MKKRIISFLVVLILGSTALDLNVEAAAVSENSYEMEETEKPECPQVECLDHSMEVESEHRKGIRYLFLGDSTACGYRDSYGNEIRSYVYYFQQRRNADVTNAAIGGATYSSQYMHNISYEMDGLDLTSYDVAFFQFGINDFVRAYPIGNEYSLNEATVCGAINVSIRRMKDAGVECYCILPFYYKGQITGIINEDGLKFVKYLNAIKNVCAKNNVKVIDFNQAFGINADNFWNFYIDSVHPGGQLQQTAGEYLDTFMRQYDDDTQVTAFVYRLYELCLERLPDTAGLNDWKNALVNRTKSGAAVAQGIFFSEEMKNRNLSDEEFVELLYEVMMDRGSDAAGKEYWLEKLEAGVSREGVFKGFAESVEFDNICSSYGIERGVASISQGRDRNMGVTMFVSRLYTKALGRDYDVAGLNDWCDRISDGEWSIIDAATTGFFESREFLNKELDNEEYVKVLYRTFLDREYDEAGLMDWVDRLDSGTMTRTEVLKGFSYSVEFDEMMKEYGL